MPAPALRLTTVLLLGASTVAAAAEPLPQNLVAAQFGVTEKGTTAYTAALARDWPWTASAGGRWSGATEIVAGRWRAAEPGTAPRWVSQLGVSPVLRWAAGSWRRVFLEAGIGAEWITPRYGSDSRRFTTRFNFADHLAIGMHMGAEARQEVSLRVEHFSNGSVRTPNPGEEFLEVRWGYRF